MTDYGPDTKQFIDPTMPKFMKDHKGDLYVEYPDGKGHPYHPNIQEPKWERRLWPMLSWLVFFFNLACASSFVADLWNGDYDNIKHVTTITTICGSYAALKYIHKRIAGHDDGRFS